jgi:hypothetical protein
MAGGAPQHHHDGLAGQVWVLAAGPAHPLAAKDLITGPTWLS